LVFGFWFFAFGVCLRRFWLGSYGVGLPCFVIGLLASPLCGAAPTFLCRRKEK
jgi:hypothetical protein